MTVKIRYKGDRVIGGVVHGRQIKLGGHVLHCTKRFPNQEADGTYAMPKSFYLEHKAILDDKKKFEVEVIGEEPAPKFPAPPDPPAPAETVKVESALPVAAPVLDNLTCPVCQKVCKNDKALRMHRMAAKHN